MEAELAVICLVMYLLADYFMTRQRVTALTTRVEEIENAVRYNHRETQAVNVM